MYLFFIRLLLSHMRFSSLNLFSPTTTIEAASSDFSSLSWSRSAMSEFCFWDYSRLEISHLLVWVAVKLLLL